MNDVFEFSRFGKYFAYDLRNLRDRFGWSMLVLCLLPMIVFVVSEVFSLTINGEFLRMPDFVRYMVVYLSLIVTVLIAPAKIWGRITDKGYGSDYLLLPASGFEKWLSMMLICFAVLPLCLSLITFAGDALCTLVFGDAYAGRLMLSEIRALKDELDVGDIRVNFFALGYVTWLCNILIFVLGALCFKKSKAAKTLLAAFLFSGLIGMAVTMAVFGQASFSNEYMDYLSEELGFEGLIFRINLITNILYTVVIVALMAACYFRIKTIKH